MVETFVSIQATYSQSSLPESSPNTLTIPNLHGYLICRSEICACLQPSLNSCYFNMLFPFHPAFGCVSPGRPYSDQDGLRWDSQSLTAAQLRKLLPCADKKAGSGKGRSSLFMFVSIFVSVCIFVSICLISFVVSSCRSRDGRRLLFKTEAVP